MFPGRVEPTIPASGRPQTDALDRPTSQLDSKNVLPFHAMKANMGRSTPPLILHLRARWRWLVSFRFRPLYSVKELGGPQSLSGFFRKGKNLKVNNSYTENPP
jgi:hypothetical protein